MCTEYEDWANLPTWEVYNYLTNNEDELEEVRDILSETIRRYAIGSPTLPQDELRKYVEQLMESDARGLDDRGMAYGFVQFAMDIVDWKAIADSLLYDSAIHPGFSGRGDTDNLPMTDEGL